MNLDDIWNKVRQDDTMAFKLMHHLLHPGMCEYASQLTGDHHVAEEVVQDVFLKVWNKRKNIYSQDGSIKKYCFRLTHNESLDVLRKRHTQKESFVRLLPSEAWMKISEQYGVDDFLIEQLEAEETAVKIKKIVDQLPDQCREIFIKSRLEGKKHKEIAIELNISTHTIEAQMNIALKKLREQLKNYLLLLIFIAY